MSDEKLNVVIAAENQMGPALSSARQDVQSFSSQVMSMGTAFVAAQLSVDVLKESARKMVEMFKEAVNVTRDHEIAMARFRLTVDATGQSFASAEPAARAWLGRMHEISSLTETQLLNGLRTLITHTDNLKTAQLLGADAANVAARTGQSYEEVTHRLSLALEGNTRGLREYAIHLDMAGKATLMNATVEERAAFIHAALMEKFGGSSQQLLGTYAEQVKLLKRNWEEFQIELGTGVVPVLMKVLGLLNSLATAASQGPLGAYVPGVGWVGTSGPDISGAGAFQSGGGGAPAGGSSGSWGTAGPKTKTSAEIMAELQAQQAQAAIAEAIADSMAKVRAKAKIAVEELLKGYEQLGKLELKWLVDDANAWEKHDLLLNHMVETVAKVREGFEKFQGVSGTQTNPIAIDALQAISQLQADYQKKIAAINATSFAEWAAQADRITKRFDDSALFVGREYMKTADNFVKNIQQPLATFFNDVATGGIGAALAKQFTKGISDGSSELAKLFGGIIVSAFGGKPDASKFDLSTDQGKAAFAQASEDARVQQGKIGGVIANIGIVAGAAMHASDVISGKVHESAVATIVSFTAAGAAVGGWIGAIVGFVVGAVAAVFAPSVGKDYKYATFGFDPKTGGAWVDPNKNIGPGEANAMVQALNAEMQGVYNAYIKILLKFPADIMVGLLGFDFAKLDPTYTISTKIGGGIWAFLGGALSHFIFGTDPTGGGYNKTVSVGEIGGAASAKFMESFDNWVKNVLPAKIAAQFQDSVSRSFTAMGMTVDAFDKLWKSMQGMDPTKALQMLADLADALVGWAKTQASMDSMARLFTTRGRGSGAELMPWMTNTTINSDGSFRARGTNDFAQSLIDGQENLGKLALSVRTLVGPEQVAAAKSLSDAMTGMVSSLVQYLNQILALQKQLSLSIDQQKNALIYAQITDPAQQSAFLNAQLAGLMRQISNAGRLGLNPSDIQGLVGQSQTLIGQISALDPTHRLDWALKALDDLNAAQLKALTAMGKQAYDQVANELKVLQPVLDWFKGLPEVVGSSFNNLTDSANHAGDALDRFSQRLDAVQLSSSQGDATGSFVGSTATRRAVSRAA